jgi:hypothetical protein
MTPFSAMATQGDYWLEAAAKWRHALRTLLTAPLQYVHQIDSSGLILGDGGSQIFYKNENGNLWALLVLGGWAFVNGGRAMVLGTGLVICARHGPSLLSVLPLS